MFVLKGNEENFGIEQLFILVISQVQSSTIVEFLVYADVLSYTFCICQA